MGRAWFPQSFTLYIYYITPDGSSVTWFQKYLLNVMSNLTVIGWLLPIDNFSDSVERTLLSAAFDFDFRLPRKKETS
jgi:hypothetical protein